MSALAGRIRAGSGRLGREARMRLGVPGSEFIAVLGVAIPAVVLSVAIFMFKKSVPIWDDGAAVLAERYPITLETLTRPFHQHLNAVPILLWSMTSSPANLLGLLLLTHVALTTGTAAFLVRRLGPRQGAALALPLGVLGSAHYDLLMPWQILYTIPLLCGLAAVWLSTPGQQPGRRLPLIAPLMVIAVASSNAGLFLVGALGLWYLLSRRWLQILALVPATVLWAAWFINIGIHTVGDDGGVALTLGIVPYTVTGLASGIGGVTGLGLTYGTALLAAAGGWVIDRRPRPDPGFVSFVVALVVMFASLSIVRSGTVEYSSASRYIYLFGFFIAFGVGAAAPRIPPSRLLVPLSCAAAALNLIILLKSLQYYP